MLQIGHFIREKLEHEVEQFMKVKVRELFQVISHHSITITIALIKCKY